MKNIRLLLLSLLVLLLPSCSSTSSNGSPAPITTQNLIASATTLGDAIIRVELTQFLAKKHPAILALLDRPKVDETGAIVAPPDGVIDLAEITAWNPTNVNDLMAVYVIVRELVSKKGGK